MSATSPMLKSNKENRKSKYISFSVVYLTSPLPVVIPSLFMDDDDGPLFMESG